jgi:hypothetical protein
MAEPNLELIQAMFQRLLDSHWETRDDIRELKERMTGVELGLAGVCRDLVSLSEADTRLQIALDRQGDRLERIERRLDLLPPTTE